MRNTNIIFYATKAVFNESTFLHCPGGSHASIPAIETGLLPVNKGNIPLEDDDQPLALAPVEGDLVICMSVPVRCSALKNTTKNTN